MSCVNRQKNLEKCTCTYSCSRKGICCECLHYHRAMNQLPACYFDKKTEAEYDRSIEKFLSSIS